MDAFFIMLRNVLLFVCLALPGFLLVKRNVLSAEQSGVLSKLLMQVGMPFLIFSGTVGSIRFDKSFLLLAGFVILIGVAYTALMFLISAPLSACEKNERTRGMLRFCSVFSNNGFLGIPLGMAVFGASSPVMTVLILLNIISNLMMYTLGVFLVSGKKSGVSLWSLLKNPVLLAFLAGIACKGLGVTEAIPELTSFSTHFSNIVTPLSMTILGIKLAGVRIPSLFVNKTMYYASFWKLIAFPAAVTALLLLCRPLHPTLISDHLILGVFLAFSMPTAGLAPTFADLYQGDTESAVAFTMGSTLLSIFTIPMLYWPLCLLLG